MAFNNAALNIGGQAMYDAITHLQLHSAGTDPNANAVGSRVARSGSVAGSGDVTITGAWTGLTSNQAVSFVSYWSASTAGTNYGGTANSGGDATANAAGEFNFSVTEDGSAT